MELFTLNNREDLQYYYLPTIYALLAIWPAVGFLPPLPQVIVYAAPLLYAVYCFAHREYFDRWYLALLAYIPIELLLANPSSVFQSWPRYILFAAILLCVSPVLQGEKLIAYRERVFGITMWACAFLGIGSFLGWFFDWNFMTSSTKDIIYKVGTFGGLTHHSMLLGPIAGVGACFLVSKAFSTKNALWGMAAIASLFAVFFSASRSATMAALTGIIVTLFRLSGSTSRFMKVGVVIFVIAASTSSLWEGALSGVVAKNHGTTELNLESRQELWEQRIDDFKSSPVYGVGFCASKLRKGYSIDMKTGRLESGTSWLVIFSMLGIVGACIVIPIFVKAFITAYRGEEELNPVICGVLTLFFVHMFAEGYVFAGGSLMAFILWLTVGVAMDSKYKTEACD